MPDRYRHNIRYFGLLAPRTKARTHDTVFALLGQTRRGKPRRLGWAASLKKSFGVDPLLDSRGERMRRIGRFEAGLDAAEWHLDGDVHARAVGELGDGEFDSAVRRQARCLPLENVHHIPSSIAVVTRIRLKFPTD